MHNFSIFSQPYYDRFSQCYKNILVVNCVPNGPIKNYVQNINLPKLSEYQYDTNCNRLPKCCLALKNINFGDCHCDLMTPNELPNLISFLLSNGYQIETQISNMLNNSPVKQNLYNTFVLSATYFPNQQPNINYMR